MSELTMIAENILDAMEAVDEAYHASNVLRVDTNHNTFDAFRAKMAELEEQLSKLKKVLENEEAFVIDELVDAISNAYMGHRADYRKTPRMEK